jgi:hypothetical protein
MELYIHAFLISALDGGEWFHAPAAFPLRKEPLLCCCWELTPSHSTVTVHSAGVESTGEKLQTQTDMWAGPAGRKLNKMDGGWFRSVTSVSTSSIFRINTPTSNIGISFCSVLVNRIQLLEHV